MKNGLHKLDTKSTNCYSQTMNNSNEYFTSLKEENPKASKATDEFRETQLLRLIFSFGFMALLAFLIILAKLLHQI